MAVAMGPVMVVRGGFHSDASLFALLSSEPGIFLGILCC